MHKEGSYNWWRANYSTDERYFSICQILKSRGINCRDTEIDHFPPNKSYEGTAYATKLLYGARPAFPLPKFLHRFHRGEGGMGGHVSTTGTTFVAKGWEGVKGWTPQLSDQMAKNNFYGAMKQDIIDKQNVALSRAGNRNLFNPVLQPAVKLAFDEKLINYEQYLDICWNYFNGLGSR